METIPAAAKGGEVIDTTDLRGKVEAALNGTVGGRSAAESEFGPMVDTLVALILSEKAEAWDESAAAHTDGDLHGYPANPYREVKP